MFFLTVIEALIFDMDGVMLDSMHLHAKAWKAAFAEEGISIDGKDIFELEGENDAGIAKNVLSKNIQENVEIEKALATIPHRKHELFESNNVTAFDNVDLCLKSLRSRFKLAVVSGSDRTIVDKMMRKYFPGIFDVTISGDDTINGKPAPDPYNKAVELLATEKEKCIVIENAILGVQSAKSAGIFTVGLPTYLKRTELENADIVLRDHNELLKFLYLLNRI